LLLAADFTRDVRQWYEEFAFHKIYQRTIQFCTVELSAFYFDILKDRLYTFAPQSAGRRSAQTVLWRICDALARLLPPIMSFTCEEIWEAQPAGSRPESIHAALFPSEAEILDEGLR